MIPTYYSDHTQLQRFNRVRTDLGVTLVQLECATHIPRSRILSYEHGRAHLPYYVAVRLGRFFMMSPDELFPEISLVEGGKVAKIWSDYVDEDSEVA
jgi:transcriptional regulator with XRE-family HTH domain